jgi:protein-S-isoprenylcysteine O-methyltransferase Ste14
MKLKLMPPTYFLFSIIVMVLLDLFIPRLRVIPGRWNYAGIILLTIGILINIAADHTFRLSGTTIKPFEESSRLVTNGLYRVSRNPMYLGFVLILTGIAFLIGSLAPFFITPLFITIIEKRFVVREEQMLAMKFGTTWRKYASRTRRWV